MYFKFNGYEFRLNFERQRMLITRYVDGQQVKELSKDPYTIARIEMKGGDGKWALYRTAQSGTYQSAKSSDPFSLEGGRLAALRAVTKSFSKTEKAFKQALWAAYLLR